MTSIKIKDPLFTYHARFVDGVNFEFSDYFRDHGVIRFDTDDNLPLYTMISVYSITIVIRSLYKTCNNRFYPQIYLKNSIYKTC